MLTCSLLYRPLFAEFASKVLHLDPEVSLEAPAYKILTRDYPHQQDTIVKARILSFSLSTWKGHAATFQAFRRFCNYRGIDPLNCHPPTMVTYLLDLAAKGKSIGVIESTLKSITFIYRWFLVQDLGPDPYLQDVMRFLTKTCPKTCNRKAALGVSEIRKIWDKLETEFSVIENVPLVQLRSFVFMVTQHASFCRFSDLAVLKLDDIVFNADYFELNIRFSKTDQAGHGQAAYVPRNVNTYHCPHKLMCLFLHKVHADPDPDVYLFPPLE
jgi:hypothetical protein